MSDPISIPNDLQTYSADGRLAIDRMYAAYQKLHDMNGWDYDIVYEFDIQTQNGDTEKLPSVVLTTKQKGPAFWILSGVHGEESAGPNAIVENIDKIAQLGEKVPVVLFPLLNPAGYVQGWRYPNEYRDWKKGLSVSDSEHILLDPNNHSTPRSVKPSSDAAEVLTGLVLSLIQEYPVLLSIDHHEDEALQQSYVYSQGRLGSHDPVALKIIDILKDSGIPIQMEGVTRFGEKVTNGVIGEVPDGSVDELLSSKKIFLNGQVTDGPYSLTVIVVETPTIEVPLEKRVQAHGNIISAYEELLAIRMKSQ